MEPVVLVELLQLDDYARTMLTRPGYLTYQILLHADCKVEERPKWTVGIRKATQHHKVGALTNFFHNKAVDISNKKNWSSSWKYQSTLSYTAVNPGLSKTHSQFFWCCWYHWYNLSLPMPNNLTTRFSLSTKHLLFAWVPAGQRDGAQFMMLYTTNGVTLSTIIGPNYMIDKSGVLPKAGWAGICLMLIFEDSPKISIALRSRCAHRS